MSSPDRRKLRFREAAEVLERRYGPVTYPSLGLVRLLHIVWYITVGKRRFVPTGVDHHRIREEKKRRRQHRRRQRRST